MLFASWQKELEAEGLSPQEARKSVIYDYYWRNPVKAAVTGFVTGVALDGASQVKQKISQSNVVSQISEAARKMTRGKAHLPEMNAKISEALGDALLETRRDNSGNLGENLTLKILEKANIPITQGDMSKAEWDDLTKTVAEFVNPTENLIETGETQGYNEVTDVYTNTPLKNFENAKINPDKLIKYALNPSNTRGKNKAIVFESALGYNQSNSEVLLKQVYDRLPESDAVVGALDQYGQRYTVDMQITGVNMREATVRTGWIIRPGSETPELVTIYVK